MADNFFQKTGQDFLKGNLVYMKLPLDVKGLFWDLRMMVDDQTWRDGTFPLGSSKRATVDDLILFYSDGTKARGNYVRKCIERLKQAGVVKTRRTSHGAEVVVLSTFIEEQELGNPDAIRKRERAAELLEVLVSQSTTLLSGLYAQTGASGLSYDMLKEYLAKRVVKPGGTGITRVTAEKLLSNLTKRGFLMFDDRGLGTLASLAPPPDAGAGTADAGAGTAGSGSEYSGVRNIPVELEPELEPEPEKGNTSYSQLEAGQLGRCPIDAVAPIGASPPGAGGGGASEASPPGGGSGVAALCADALRESESDVMTEPGDAYRVRDPVHAAMVFLRTKPGWQAGSGSGAKDASSKRILLAKWTALRKAVGDDDTANMIWRDHLRDIFEDGYDKNWNSFTKVFVARLNKVIEASGVVADAH